MRRREFIAGLGAAATWPLAARAQPPAMPVIGVLNRFSPRPRPEADDAFRRGLAEAGYVEGQNVAIEYRGAGTQMARLPGLAVELVHRQVAVIVAIGALSPILAAKEATPTIPIVFAYGGDPVRDGLVASLDHPRGNVTGMTVLNGELVGKHLSLVGDLVPRATTVAFLSGDSRYLGYEDTKSQVLSAARALGRQVVILETRGDHYEAAFETLVQRQAGALVVGAFTFPNTNKIVALAERYQIPTIYPNRRYVVSGGLMSYGGAIRDMYRHAGIYTGRILKGEKPADLPVMLPTKFELVINLKTAKTLGLEIPPTLLAIADEVIE
jgi:putative tryptophan/tyrosine transport system substrate-binding protein